jgi:hypothetical protein
MSTIDSADLWFRPDLPFGVCAGGWMPADWDRLRYVVWIDPGRPNDELAPRTALHVQARS